MDAEVHSDLQPEEKSIFHEPKKNANEKFVAVKSKNNESEQLLPSFTSCTSLGPITPDFNREVGDFPIYSKSPLISSDSSPEIKKENIECPFTPVDGVFDPFAPGPDKLLHAPRRIKLQGLSQFPVVRRLDFEESSEADVVDAVSNEETLLEIVYDDLLEAIVMEQREEGFLDDGCKTPDLAKRLSGVAETCPDAPMKCDRKPRNIDKSLCRRLEF